MGERERVGERGRGGEGQRDAGAATAWLLGLGNALLPLQQQRRQQWHQY